MARLSLHSPNVVATVAAGFTEEEEGASTVVEDFMEAAGSGAVDFIAGAGSAAEGSEAEGFTVEVDSAAEVSAEAARFAGEPDFAEEPSVEVFVVMASGAVSVSAAIASGTASFLVD